MKGGPKAPCPNPGPNPEKAPVPLLSTPYSGVDVEEVSALDTFGGGADVVANIVALNGFAAPRVPVA